MFSKRHPFLVVGRVNADIVLSDVKFDVADKLVKLSVGGLDFSVQTDSVASRINDKVTSIESLDDVVLDIISHVGREKYELRWGGGGFNSAKTLADVSVFDKASDIYFLTPSNTTLVLGGDLGKQASFSMVPKLAKYSILHNCLNLTEINYSLVLGGENKIVIRNKPKNADFEYTDFEKSTCKDCLPYPSGVLINALNHPKMTWSLVQQVLNNNHRHDCFDRKKMHPGKCPDYKSVMTVVTPGISKEYLFEEIFPYSGLVFNETDIVKIFYGKDTVVDSEYKLALEAMSQLRYGIPIPSGARAKIQDVRNSIYVSLGRDGYLVSPGMSGIEGNSDWEYYHIRTNEKATRELDERIKENHSSTNGAGDAFASGAIYQETIGEGSDVIKSGCMINTVVSRHLNLPRTISEDEIQVYAHGKLKDYYKF